MNSDVPRRSIRHGGAGLSARGLPRSGCSRRTPRCWSASGETFEALLEVVHEAPIHRAARLQALQGIKGELKQ